MSLPANPSRAFVAANPHLYGHHTPSRLPNPECPQQAVALDTSGGRETPCPRRTCVRFVLRRVSLLDVDAKWGSLKDVLDGLATAGLIPGDREDQITLQCEQEKVAHYSEEETVITITTP